MPVVDKRNTWNIVAYRTAIDAETGENVVIQRDLATCVGELETAKSYAWDLGQKTFDDLYHEIFMRHATSRPC